MVDRGAIENTLNRYTLAYDETDLEDLVDTFTADASFSMRIAGGDLIGPFEGRDAIRKLMVESLASQTDQRRHLCTNLVIREAADRRVRAESYLLLVTVENGAIRVLSSGRYEDELTEDDGVWRISRRHLALDLPY